MLIKICGIQDVETARFAQLTGADLIGVVFAKSKRQITKEVAQDIAKTVKIPVVGVFVNESIKTINQLVKDIPLDYVQLHGDETEGFAKKITVPVIKAFKKGHENPHYASCYHLIDNEVAGAGIAYDYRTVTLSDRTFLAGGLTVENVTQAVQLQPIGIDVSSGVETNGVKDKIKIKQFIEKARSVTHV